MSERPHVPSVVFQKHFEEYCGNHRPMIVLGPVDLSAVTFKRGLRLRDVEFRDHVSFSASTVPSGVEIRHCTFHRGLDLSQMDIDGDLLLEGVTATAIIACGAQVEGHLQIIRTIIRRDNGDTRLYLLNLASTSVGEFTLSGIKSDDQSHELRRSPLRMALIESHINAAAMRSPIGIRIAWLKGWSLNLSDMKTQDVSIYNVNLIYQLEMSSVRAFIIRLSHLSADSVGLRQAECHELHFSSAAVTVIDIRSSRMHALWLKNTLVRRDVVLGACTIDLVHFSGELPISIPEEEADKDAEKAHGRLDDIRGVSISRNLDLWGCEVTIQILIEAIRVIGRFWMENTTVGRLRVQGSTLPPQKEGPQGTPVIEADTIGTVHPSRLGAILLTQCDIRSDCDLTEITVGGLSASTLDGQITINGCKFGTDLRLWRPDRIDDVSGVDKVVPIGLAHADARCIIIGNLSIRNSSIRQDLVLVGVKVTAGNADIARRAEHSQPASICLDGSKIIGRILTSWSVTDRASPKSITPASVSAGSLTMIGVEAAAIDLTGLSITAGGNSEHAPDVEARDIVVHQDMRLFDQPGRFGSIDGSIHLERARINHLVVTADSFTKAWLRRQNGEAAAKETARNSGLVLEGAMLSHLRIPFRADCVDQAGCNGYPSPLDLSDSEIRNWSFEEEEAAQDTAASERPFCNGQQPSQRTASTPALHRRSDGDVASTREDIMLAKCYLDVLDNDESFSRGVYRSVARKLRDEGHVNAALRLHYAERYRAFWEHRGKWSPGKGRLRNGFPAVRERVSRLRIRLYAHLLRFGGSPLPLAGYIASLALLSGVLVAAEPRNFEISTSNRMLIAAGQQGQQTGRIRLDADTRPCLDHWDVLSPGANKWSWGDAVWVTVRYHVPLAGIFARDDVVPTDDRGVTLSIERWTQDRPNWGCVTQERPAAGSEDSAVVENGVPPLQGAGWSDRVLISPEDWFQLMAILNWIMWPLLLTALLRRMVIEER